MYYKNHLMVWTLISAKFWTNFSLFWICSDVLKLLEDLESNINNDNFGKSTNELIANVCNYLKEQAIYFDQDLCFKEQMDVYFNLLRNILRNPKLDRLSRALILEVIELRAANWVYNQDIDS